MLPASLGLFSSLLGCFCLLGLGGLLSGLCRFGGLFCGICRLGLSLGVTLIGGFGLSLGAGAIFRWSWIFLTVVKAPVRPIQSLFCLRHWPLFKLGQSLLQTLHLVSGLRVLKLQVVQILHESVDLTGKAVRRIVKPIAHLLLHLLGIGKFLL